MFVVSSPPIDWVTATCGFAALHLPGQPGSMASRYYSHAMMVFRRSCVLFVGHGSDEAARHYFFTSLLVFQ